MADTGEYSMKIEATEVIKEIKYAVKSADLSQSLNHSNNIVYFNLETKEDNTYCVELTVKGFRLMGNHFDTLSEATQGARYYETIYSMLDDISEGYRNTFSDTLIQRLQGLQDHDPT